MAEYRDHPHECEIRSKPRTPSAPAMPVEDYRIRREAPPPQRITPTPRVRTAPAEPPRAQQSSPTPPAQTAPAERRAANRAPVRRAAHSSAPREDKPSNLQARVLVTIALIIVLLVIIAALMQPQTDSAAQAENVPSILPAPTVAAVPSPTPKVVYAAVQAAPKTVCATPSPVPKAIYSAPAVEYVRATGDVYIRTGPARQYDIVSVLKCGSRAEYLGQSRTDERGVAWYSVRCNDRTGWVSSRYARLE